LVGVDREESLDREGLVEREESIERDELADFCLALKEKSIESGSKDRMELSSSVGESEAIECDLVGVRIGGGGDGVEEEEEEVGLEGSDRVGKNERSEPVETSCIGTERGLSSKTEMAGVVVCRG
jgi:hypothetical protein